MKQQDKDNTQITDSQVNKTPQKSTQAKTSPTQANAHADTDTRKTTEPENETGNKNSGPKGENL